MVADFEVLEHTADVGLLAQGRSLAEAFINAARGLFSLITDLETIEERETHGVEVSSEDQEGLAVAWLNELIYLFDARQTVFKGFTIRELTSTHLVAEARGEKVDPSRHPMKIGVKAATYHMLKIEQTPEGFSLQVLLDI